MSGMGSLPGSVLQMRINIRKLGGSLVILAHYATTSTTGAKISSLHQARKTSASESSGANVNVGSLGSDI